MPLAGSGSDLRDAIITGLNSKFGFTAGQKTDAEATWLIISDAIVAHLVANTTVSPLGEPTPMAAPNGPISGTGKLL